MTYRTKTLTLAVRCDAPRCDRQLAIPASMQSLAPYETRFQRYLAHLGWTLWVNRGQRQYCPEHQPVSANMHKVEVR